ncbi:hypothetical protein DPMN_064720 [Dreissena polymorpha]|uniref:Uncharacterized protein n=1 Tax=Dreissena polymorpha TaxID=45954 RepID=A0A9D4HKC9_DREPO|nr:hypothetical protein DPMN_064720 [Dreissena polymorpha]
MAKKTPPRTVPSPRRKKRSVGRRPSYHTLLKPYCYKNAIQNNNRNHKEWISTETL